MSQSISKNVYKISPKDLASNVDLGDGSCAALWQYGQFILQYCNGVQLGKNLNPEPHDGETRETMQGPCRNKRDHAQKLI